MRSQGITRILGTNSTNETGIPVSRIADYIRDRDLKMRVEFIKCVEKDTFLILLSLQCKVFN